MSLPHCPKCNSEYTYEDNGMYICPECAYEWNDAEPAQESDELIVKDANGNLLADGDSVVLTLPEDADKSAEYVLEFTTESGDTQSFDTLSYEVAPISLLSVDAAAGATPISFTAPEQ